MQESPMKTHILAGKRPTTEAAVEIRNVDSRSAGPVVSGGPGVDGVQHRNRPDT